MQKLGGRSKVLFGLRPEACTPSFESAMINGKADFVENTGNLKTATLKLQPVKAFICRTVTKDCKWRIYAALILIGRMFAYLMPKAVKT